MAQNPAWRVEFDRNAARDLRKLGAPAQQRILRYLQRVICITQKPI